MHRIIDISIGKAPNLSYWWPVNNDCQIRAGNYNAQSCSKIKTSGPNAAVPSDHQGASIVTRTITFPMRLDCHFATDTLTFKRLKSTLMLKSYFIITESSTETKQQRQSEWYLCISGILLIVWLFLQVLECWYFLIVGQYWLWDVALPTGVGAHTPNWCWLVSFLSLCSYRLPAQF